MLRKFVAVGLIALTAISVAGPTNVEAAKTPTCHGKKATQWLTEPGILYFTEGDDVFVGTSGEDAFLVPDFESPDSASGTDVVCGLGGNDFIFFVSGEGSIADGGSGQDIAVAGPGAKAIGGSGGDYLIAAFGPGATASGGAGSDGAGVKPADLPPYYEYLEFLMDIFDSNELPFEGGVWAFMGATADGGAFDDIVVGVGAEKVLGGSGKDDVFILEDSNKVDCGSDADFIYYDIDAESNSERRCEFNYD